LLRSHHAAAKIIGRQKRECEIGDVAVVRAARAEPVEQFGVFRPGDGVANGHVDLVTRRRDLGALRIR
jgi:hypothetical protein